LFPIKSVYLLAVAVFEVGRFVCGVTTTSNSLIGVPALAGVDLIGVLSGAW